MSTDQSAELQKTFRALILEKRLHDLKNLMDKTHVEPLEYLVQIGYHTYLDEAGPDRIKLYYFLKLHEITTISPENVTLRRASEIALRMDSLMMLEALVKGLNLEPGSFRDISGAVKKAFRDFVRRGQFNQISRLMTMTGITPEDDVIQRGYRTYLLEGRFLSVKGLREGTGVEPDNKTIAEVSKWYFANYSMLRQLNMADLDGQKKVGEESNNWLEWIEEFSKIGRFRLCFRCGYQNRTEARVCVGCKATFSGEPAIAYKEAAVAAHTIIIKKQLIGHTILKERFRILQLLGQGGMGEIYLADDTRLQRKVAIKTIANDSVKDPEARERLLREAQIASQLDHPNICTIYEIAEDENSDYIIMQFIDGVTLEKQIREKPPDNKTVLSIAIQVAEGLVVAHEKGILHRDLKPSNLMIDRSGRVKILDFGLAQFLEPLTQAISPTVTPRGFVVGTPAYMSPEQILGLDLDSRSDLFSFGLLVYEMMTGKNPFIGKDLGTTLFNVLHLEVPFDHKFPPELAGLLQRALHKDRNQRFENFTELREALLALKND